MNENDPSQVVRTGYIIQDGVGFWELSDGTTEPAVFPKVPVEDVLRREGEDDENEEVETVGKSYDTARWIDMPDFLKKEMAEMLGLSGNEYLNTDEVRRRMAQLADSWREMDPACTAAICEDNPFEIVFFEE